MTRIMKNGNSLSKNIHDLLLRLRTKNLLTDLKQDIDKSKKGKGAFKKMFEVYYEFVLENIPSEKLPPDKKIGEMVGSVTDSFNDLKQDFYLRIIDFLARTVELKDEEWHKDCQKILKEVDALWELGFREHAEIRFLYIYSRVC
jgi:hypothetical protein